jgi:hypothetical protein
MSPSSEPQDTITVTKIVLSREVAESEVARLNTLNADKGAKYFWQTTRLYHDGYDRGNS